MKNLYLILCFLLSATIAAPAQSNFAITGKVTDETGVPLKAATVFLSGSQKITICDTNGHFKFNHVAPGNYQLTVSMIGFTPYSENIVVKPGRCKPISNSK